MPTHYCALAFIPTLSHSILLSCIKEVLELRRHGGIDVRLPGRCTHTSGCDVRRRSFHFQLAQKLGIDLPVLQCQMLAERAVSVPTEGVEQVFLVVDSLVQDG